MKVANLYCNRTTDFSAGSAVVGQRQENRGHYKVITGYRGRCIEQEEDDSFSFGSILVCGRFLFEDVQGPVAEPYDFY